MPLEIRESRKKKAFNLVLSISALAFYIYCAFFDGTVILKQEFYWVPVFILGVIILCFGFDYLDNTPLYVLHEEGLYAKQKNTIFPWQAIRAYHIKFKKDRFVGVKVLHLFDHNKKVLLTLVLTGTDCSEENLEMYLVNKIKLDRKEL